MQRRSIRAAALALLLMVAVAAASFLWHIQQRSDARAAAEDSLTERVESIRDLIAAIATAQQAYVAPGQLDEPWFERSSTLFARLNDELVALRGHVRSARGIAGLAEMSDAQATLVAADERIRQNLVRGQELMAADVIFSDGQNLVDTLTTGLKTVRGAERSLAMADRATLEQERWVVLGLAALSWLIAAVAMLVGTAPSRKKPQPEAPAPPDVEVPPVHLPAPSAPSLDLAAAAALCTELSRVADTDALKSLLGRAVSMLDATGVTVWLGAGDQLFAVLGHGYSPDTMARFGPVARTADTAVARAWRTGHATTVPANGTSGSAVVLPMFGAEGCIGVLAFENRPSREHDPSLVPVAAMIAAQVAAAVAAWPAPSVPEGAADQSTARSA